MFDKIINFYSENFVLAFLLTDIAIFLIVRLFKTADIHLATKSQVKKTKKSRKKKYNGILLVEKIKKKRKKNSNSFQKLNSRGKKLTKKYFKYKLKALPIITKYSYGKFFKRSNKKITIVAKNSRKTLIKISMTNGLKNMIKLTNKYHCLDEFILFLHHLPDAILDQSHYDFFIGETDISVSYLVK